MVKLQFKVLFIIHIQIIKLFTKLNYSSTYH